MRVLKLGWIALWLVNTGCSGSTKDPGAPTDRPTDPTTSDTDPTATTDTAPPSTTDTAPPTGSGTTDTGACGTGLCGDVNGDATVDVLDVVLLLDWINGTTAPGPAGFWAGDVNNDGVLDATDVARIEDHILNGTPLDCG